VAKGAKYLSLDRESKLEILWNKITEDDRTAEEASLKLKFFFTDMKQAFDEMGDEFDCREKTVHQFGNVAKVRWVDLEGHPYTGIFNGGSKTGLARLSWQVPPELLFLFGGADKASSMALKFLRDGIDSGNIMGSSNHQQTSWNFF